MTRESCWVAACILSATGSLSGASIRGAGRRDATRIEGDLEILSLSGTLSADGAHLHVTVGDPEGGVRGGHLLPGCVVRTTAEIVIGILDGVRFRRSADPVTGYAELVIDSLEDVTP